MNQLKGTAQNLKIIKREQKSWFRRRRHSVFRARMMVAGQAVCLISPEPIAITEGDRVTITGTVRRGVLYARSYANGTRDHWSCRKEGLIHSLISAIILIPALSLAVLNLIPLLAGLAVAAVSGVVWSAARWEEYRHARCAQKALRRYRIGPAPFRPAVSA